MFELHITCTKDIDKIKIDFSDGSVCTTERKSEKIEKTEKNEKSEKNKDSKVVKETNKESKRNNRDIINHEEVEVENVVVEKPSIPEVTETKVEDYLQGLDF